MSGVGGKIQLRIRNSSSPFPETGGGENRLHFQGALEKRGQLKTWSWRRYWFVLHGDSLSYFKDERMSSALSQGLINMNEAHVVKACTTVNRGFPFEIITRTKKHILSAQTATVRDQWVDYLQRAMKVRRPITEYSLSMSRKTCNSIEDDENMSEQVQALLAKSAMGARCISSPEFTRVHDSTSSDPSSPTTPTSPVQHQLARKQTIDLQRDSGCESEAPQMMTSSPSSANGNRDSQTGYDPQILRRSKKVAVTRLHPTVSNAEASKFFYDSITHEDDVFTASSKEPIEAKDSGMSDSGSASTRNSQTPSTLENMSFKYPAIPELPHPRLEMTWGSSPFDKIRLFLANNRGPEECYPTPDKAERGGKAINKLKAFLAALDNRDESSDEEEFVNTSL